MYNYVVRNRGTDSSGNDEKEDEQGRQIGGLGGCNPSPPEFWRGGFNPPP